ncbi:MAG: hypothetical protein WCW04_02490 [Candidatus Paceibacterota bacterium]
MKNFKYFFVCVLYLNILGCQSCNKKDPALDPEPVKIFHTVTVLPCDGVTVSPILPNNSTRVEDGKSFSIDLNSGPNKRYKILSSGVVVADYRTGSFYYLVPSVKTDLNIQIMSETVTYTVTASAGTGGTVTPLSTVVEYGSDLPFNITENAEYTLTSIKVNGVSVAIVKPYVLKNITANSDVQVGFTLTNFLILSNGADNKSRYWKMTKEEWYDVNHVYEYTSILNPVLLTDKWYFYTNGKMESFNTAGVLDANDVWNVLPTNIFTLSSGDRIYTVIELTDKKFVYEQKGQFTLGVTEYVRTTLVRQ